MNTENKEKKLSIKVIAGLFGFIILFFVIMAASLHFMQVISITELLYPGSTMTSIPELSKKPKSAVDENAVIAKVGDERIYQKDLNYELAYYPVQNVDAEKLLIEKLVKDSIILQAGKSENIIELDNSVFDSINKDYQKRVNLVEQVKAKYENTLDSVEGHLISLWFFNSMPGAAGYEQGKEIVNRKITLLHSRVKSGQITIQQASQEIISDSSLEQIDPAYKSNAIYSFKAGPTDSIAFDKSFDEQIRKLNAGEVTDVYLVKDLDEKTGRKIDAVYAFAQLTKRIKGENKVAFDEWLSKKETSYVVTYY